MTIAAMETSASLLGGGGDDYSYSYRVRDRRSISSSPTPSTTSSSSHSSSGLSYSSTTSSSPYSSGGSHSTSRSSSGQSGYGGSSNYSGSSSSTVALASMLAGIEVVGEKHAAIIERQGSKAKLRAKLETQDSLDNFPDKYQFEDNKHVAEVVHGLKSLYEQGALVDVTLIVDDEEFPCHKCVLAASSPYFNAMFTTNLAESRQSKIRLIGIDAPSMRLILDYAYTSQIEINEDNVQGLMLAVNMFQMPTLRDACARFLEKHITVGNSIGIYFFAVAHNCEKLEALAKTLVMDNFSEVCREEEFMSLSKDKVIDLISRDELNVDKEEIVYEAVMAWVKHDPESRRSDLADVVAHVRFGLISPYYIHDVVERDRVVSHNKGCQQIIDSALQYHVLRDRRQDLDLSKVNTTARKGMPFADMFVFLSNTSEMLSDINNPTTYRVKALPELMEDAESVITGENSIYVMARQPTEFSGRRLYSNRRGGLFLYDHFEKKWLPRAAMNVARCNFSMAVLDGLIYAVGGSDGDDALASVECYNPTTNIWKQISPMPQAVRFGHRAVAVGGRLYCIGGESEDTVLDGLYCYNPRLDSWETVANMILPRTCASVAVTNREIYVIGGSVAMGEVGPENMLKSVEIYNPDNNEWRFGPELQEGRMSFVTAVLNGGIYIFGGENGMEDCEAEVWRLDPGQSSWVEDKGTWPPLVSPYSCVVGRMSKDSE
ncbi:kelch-like protein 24 [Diadema setosum]|uniref:kelch-like protein 24 n=1 Tax=Diadema setosum TaxID=31175 RepID=UPI003B3BD0FA